MRSRRLLTLSLALASATSTSLASPALATAAPLTIQAHFAGTGDVWCFGGRCYINVSSIVCWIAGVDGTRVPFANGCDASLQGSVPAVGPEDAAACALVGSGTFGVSDPVSGHGLSHSATIVASPAGATFATPPLLSMSGYTYAGYGYGSVKPCVSSIERDVAQFEGTFTYVRVL